MSEESHLSETFVASDIKLLRHLGRLQSFKDGVIRPIQIQMAPTELCDEDCSFCSMANRIEQRFLPFTEIEVAIRAFVGLGAKSLELTGGSTMLYRDPDTRRTITDVIELSTDLGLKVGIITNSTDLRRIAAGAADRLDWVRVSLPKMTVCR
jgi:molybdenum cofactor biosynthesis enzyme MoaA